MQSIYAGCNRLGGLIGIQMLSITAALVVMRTVRTVRWALAVALAGLCAAQGIFWQATYPANVATANWTSIPQDWEHLRWQWEYSHAAGAACQLLTMAALIIAALSLPTAIGDQTGTSQSA